jgi:type VI secretion system secreted protein VgrG
MNVVAALLPTFDTVRIELSIGGEPASDLAVSRIVGADALSRVTGSEIAVTTTAERQTLLQDDLGKEIVAKVTVSGHVERVVRGVLVEVVPAEELLSDNTRASVLVVMPLLSELGRVEHSRVFHDKTLQEIVEALFSPWGIRAEFRLDRDLAPHAMRHQFRETDLDFLLRLLAEEGIHFFFLETEEETKVVFTNFAQGFVDTQLSIPYRGTEGAVTVEHVRTLGRAERLSVGSVQLTDYDFLKPSTDLTITGELGDEVKPRTLRTRAVYEHPARYKDPSGVGLRMGTERLHALNADVQTWVATTTSIRLASGTQFSIEAHPDAVNNRKYTVVSTRFTATRSDVLGDRQDTLRLMVHATLVPAETPLHPQARPVPKPPIQKARVVGPDDDEPNAEHPGRVKVRYYWDRRERDDESSTAWVRVMTSMAGPNTGAIALPRVGSEVVVDYLNGDIDEPIVIGALFHEENPPPWDLPANASRVGVRLKSVGGRAMTEWYAETRAGKEVVSLSAPRDRTARIARNDSESVGANQSSSVGANRSVNVGANSSLTVGGNHAVTVTKLQAVTVGEGRSQTITKGGDALTVSDGDYTVGVSKGQMVTTVKEAFRVGAKNILGDAGEVLAWNGKNQSKLLQGGDAVALVFDGGKADLGAKSDIVVHNGSGQIEMKGGKISVVAADELSLTCGSASITLKKDGTLTITGAKEVGVACQQSTVKLEPAKAAMNGPATNIAAVGMTEIAGAIIKIG